jgi:hypothetical protein
MGFAPACSTPLGRAEAAAGSLPPPVLAFLARLDPLDRFIVPAYLAFFWRPDALLPSR